MPIDAVIFDWGGTLTAWHDIDFHAESLALAQAVVGADPDRHGILELVDAAVYTSEIAWTKPSEQAFRAAMDAVGVGDPSRCVYVGDRLFDDVWGARNAGLKAIHLPHSNIPVEQVGHTEGEPDAVVQGLEELPELVRRWS